MNIDFKYYLGIFWRRFPYFLVVAALFTSIGLTVAMILPPEYKASATLLVEDSQIPDRLATSTVQTSSAQQLQIIQQQLLTRANLIETANRLNVYGDASGMTASEIVDDMRSRTTFAREGGRQAATIVRIGFRSPNPRTAAAVVNDFVTLVMQENVEMRTARAGDTLDFFRQEVDRLSAELDTQSSRLLEFQIQNAAALPSSEGYLRQEKVSLENRIAQLDRDIANLTEQRQRIVDIFERTGVIDGTADTARSPDERALFEAQRKLDEALLVYAPENPRVKFLQSRIELLKSRVAQLAGTEDGAGPQSLIDTQLAEIDDRIAGLQQDSALQKTRLSEIDTRLSQIPVNLVAQQKLTRDYDNTQQQYNQAISRLATAQTGERIELLSKGERISVVEQATVPERPTSPNRPLIAVAGAGVGVAAGFGLILLLELLNRSIRRPVELTDRLGVTPIAVLPYIRTERETVAKRMIVLLVLAFLLIVVPAVLFYVHSTIKPLDGLIEPVANKFGMSVSPN